MSDNQAFIVELMGVCNDLAKQGSATTQAIQDLASRFDRLEKRLFGENGELPEVKTSLKSVQSKLIWAKGWLAGMIATVSILSGGVMLLLQWTYKKMGGH